MSGTRGGGRLRKNIAASTPVASSVPGQSVEPSRPELVVGLVAAVGTPLDLVQQALEEKFGDVDYGAELLHLSSYADRFKLKARAPRRNAGEAVRIQAMMDRGSEVRVRTGRNDVLALLAIADIRVRRGAGSTPLPGRAFILRQLKRPEEVHLLRQTYGDGFILLGVYCSLARRTEHLRSRGLSTTEIKALVERDEKEQSESGQELRDTFHLADAFIEVGQEAEQVHRDVQRLLWLLFSEKIVGPTPEEFGMFQAWAAALRSTQLGRQVGAAILSSSRDVLAVGTNDVPKADGGLYFEGDPNDTRDHVIGRDSTDEAEEVIVREIASRLEPRWATMNAASRRMSERAYREQLRGSRITSLTEFGRAVHAEAEALLAAGRVGVSARGATLYCTTFPCHVCAKHIVAAGIRTVVYVEPYAKSRVAELYKDSIAVEESTDDRVVFRPFVGVAPRRYAQLFSMRAADGSEIARKDKDGRVLMSRRWLRVRMPYFSALEREKLAADQLSRLSGDRL